MKRTLHQIVKSAGIYVSINLQIWVIDRCVYADLDHPIGWRDHLRWYLEGKLNRLFTFFYDGSDEELRAVEQDEVPLKYMSKRQLAHWLKLQWQAQDSVKLLTWRQS
jgi:hypothetical protein